jgi:hypothetical protein
VALSLEGFPDLVMETLHNWAAAFTDEVAGNEEDKSQLIDLAHSLVDGTLQFVKEKIPDGTQQGQRIHAAKAYIDDLYQDLKVNRAQATEIKNGNDDKDGKCESDKLQDIDRIKSSVMPDAKIESVYHSLQARLASLVEAECPLPQDTPDAPPGTWYCDGQNDDGTTCGAKADWRNECFQCIYCYNRNLCRRCLDFLRQPGSHLGIMDCSPKHRWLRIPPQGSDVYVGIWAKKVCIPKSVRPMEGDEQVMEAYYGNDGSLEEITVEKWKERIADEWELSLSEIKNEMHGSSAPESEGEVKLKVPRKDDDTEQA